MNIDRNNYEEFFILYLDNELSASDRQQVEEFANANADLKAELELLLQSKLLPETEITFNGKTALLKKEGEITGETATMLLYVDHEMDLTQKKVFEEWIVQHPDAKKELELFQQTRFQPEHIVFPEKQSLYRREERRVVAIRWWRMAAAAALLLGVSTAAFMFNQNRVENQVAKINQQQQEKNALAQNNKGAQTNKQSATAQLDAIAQPADNNSNTTKEVNGTEARDIASAVAAFTTTGNSAAQKEQQLNDKARSSVQTTDGVIENNPSNSVQEQTSVVITKRDDLSKTLDPSFAITDGQLVADPSLTINKQINPLPTVTQEEDQPLDIMNEPGKKNRLRGFFRKITRTFEKTTNIKATDGDDRLLVGGLAIKF